MFKKFHVDTREVPARFVAPAKSGIIDWSSGCIGCLECVKKACPHQAYDQRGVDPVTLQDRLDAICQDCFRCVQSCPQRLIQKSLNPEFAALGDDYWTPEIIATTYSQAGTGKIPVSGAGYGGPFSGPGFDAMWTDMSEIVRPTRDGIHGREYISTSIQLGRRHDHLVFDPKGRLETPSPLSREVPLPILFQLPERAEFGPAVIQAVGLAAEELTTILLPPGLEGGDDQVFWTPDPSGLKAALAKNPDKVIGVGVGSGRGQPRAGGGAGPGGGRSDPAPGRFPRPGQDRPVHQGRGPLGPPGAGGPGPCATRSPSWAGAASPWPSTWPRPSSAAWTGWLSTIPCSSPWSAGSATSAGPGRVPVLINEIEPAWGAQRIMNLVGAWRDQLLEVMGAMGIREVRRLRGEVGRAMFQEELEAEIFAPLFGNREKLICQTSIKKKSAAR